VADKAQQGEEQLGKFRGQCYTHNPKVQGLNPSWEIKHAEKPFFYNRSAHWCNAILSTCHFVDYLLAKYHFIKPITDVPFHQPEACTIKTLRTLLQASVFAQASENDS
jgi:hypothetical protein